MSYNKPEKGEGGGPIIHKIRITLTSRKVSSLEKVCQELLERAKTKDLRVKGPVRLPTKKLRISTRKTPCGEGSKTWDTYEMRIHKRLIEGFEKGPRGGRRAQEKERTRPGMLVANVSCSLNAPTEVVKQIIVNIEAGVEVEVTIAA
ncbi:MAG: hypothetical protein Q9201_004865 [Fulgogasparrea decipioides]